MPAEVLNRICHFTLQDPQKVTLDFESPRQSRSAQGGRVRVGGQPHLLALTQTCRKIRTDTRLMFYDVNEIVVLIRSLLWNRQLKFRAESIERFRRWVEELDFERAKCIRTLELQSSVIMQSQGSFELARAAMGALGHVARFFVGTGKS